MKSLEILHDDGSQGKDIDREANSKERKMKEINRVLFIGSKQLGFRVLQEIYSMMPSNLVGILTLDDTSDRRTRYNSFIKFANERGLKLYTAIDRMHSEWIIKEISPDFCFVVGWYWLIGEDILSSVPFGFIGIHNSLLPRFRGGSPLVWSIIEGEKEVGFTIFSFTSGMDDGPIWAQGSISVEDHDYISSVLQKLEDRVIEVIRDVYPKILSGDLEPVEQNHHLATYCAQRFPEDGNIDWNKKAYDVYNFIRAQSDPYPGAFTFLRGQKMIIWKARIFERPYFGTPGQVARITNDEVYIVCGDNRAVVLEEVEFDGSRGKPTKFIKSIRERLSNTSK